MYWKAFEKDREKWYEPVKREVAKEFEAERKAVLKAYEAGGEKAALKAIEAGKPAWMKIYTEIYVEVMEEFGGKVFGTLKKDIADERELKLMPKIFNVFDKFVQKFIATTVAQKVVGVCDVTKGKIQAVVKAGEIAGESIGQIMKRLDTLYLEQIIPNRSEVIARTEVIGASNAGSSHAADQTGLKLNKEWLSTRDDRTRDTHVSIDGEIKPKEEKYSNDLMFPGDPTGTAEEVIQCRCTEIYKRVK